MKNIILIISLFIALLSSGCASVTGTTGQSVSVETRQKTDHVVGASCELSNSKGKWFVSTPGSVQIRRSNDDLVVICNKDGYKPGTATVTSDTKGTMFGNIIIGGAIGAVVDHTSGAAYEYPTIIQVMMGESSKVDSATRAEISSQNITSTTQTLSSNPTKAFDMEAAKKKCSDLGFKMGTDTFGQCILKLTN